MNAALSLIKSSDGRFLLVQEGNPKCHGLWGFPGGRQEEGETLFQTAAREVLEETGLFVKKDGYQREYKNINKKIRGIVFSSIILDGEISPGPEILDVGWFFPLEIKEMAKQGKLRGDYILEALEDYLKYQNQKGEK